jgi:hypothetical protein
MKYWEWFYSIPVSKAPRLDASGTNCGINQTGPVWFLDAPIGGKFSTSCNIPEGKAIFVPLLVGICGTVDSEVKSDQGITDCASSGHDGGRVILSIDGIRQLDLVDVAKDVDPLKNKEFSSNRTITDFFELYSVQDNFFNDPVGLDKKRAEGIFAIIKPLPLGNHVIFFHVHVISPHAAKSDEFNYSNDVTFNLKISKTNQ